MSLSITTSLGRVEDRIYIPLIKSDDKTVILLFRSATGEPEPIPATATAAMLDSSGSSVGTATVSTITAAAGYVSLRLQAPSNGNLPTTLRITFTGGSGEAFRHDIPIRSHS
jgi:hypothetical protein